LDSFTAHVEIAKFSEIEGHFDHIIFEGAQGLRLDQHSIDFPHVTYSNTGLDNVVALLDPSRHKLRVHYVTRTYLTRHGVGKLEGEHEKPESVVDETNIHNEFQGSLRFAPLSLNRMRGDIRRDLVKAIDFDCKEKLMVTCCDQIEPNPLLFSHMLPRYETCWSAAGEWRVPERIT
jgi:adenylosuccinate synthase